MKVFTFVYVVAALGITTPVLAQAPGAVEPRVETAQSFVSNAAQDGMTEVALGKVAAEKGQSADVKQFGGRMVKDHGKANLELQALAKTKNLKMPARLDAEHQAMVDMLSSKSGAEFDSSYAQHMSTDHAMAIQMFERASRLEDDAVATFAQKTLPTLKAHKEMADSLNASRVASSTDP